MPPTGSGRAKALAVILLGPGHSHGYDEKQSPTFRRTPLMRRYLVIAAVLLLGATPVLAQRAIVPIPFRPYVPPQPRPFIPGGIPALGIYPDLTSYFQSAMFYGDFPREYALSLGPMPLTLPPPLPPRRLPPELDPERAKLTLQVPLTAEVFIDGMKLKQNGATRKFLSPKLQSGLRFRYQVLVTWSDGQKPVERSLDVSVAAGERPVLVVLAPLAK